MRTLTIFDVRGKKHKLREGEEATVTISGVVGPHAKKFNGKWIVPKGNIEKVVIRRIK